MTDRPVVVLGLMGAGKTTVARLIAQHLGRPLRDSDADIEAATGHTAATLAAGPDGRRRLHDLEAEHVLSALAEGPVVIAAAASVVERPVVRTALAAARVLWLDAPPEVLAARMTSSTHRPDYGEPLEVVQALDRRRRPLFTAVADVVIDASKPTGTVQRDALAAVDVTPPPYT